MRASATALVHAMTAQFQSGSNFRRPSEFVMVKKPPDAENFLIPEARLPNVLSIEIDSDIESTAKTFTIVCSNEDGILSPDYREGKYESRRLNYELPFKSPWQNVLLPETEIVIHLGYEPNYLKMLTGSIDEVNISADGRTITITGRSVYKRAMANTIVPESGKSYLIDDKKMNVGLAIKKLLDNVKVPNVIDTSIQEPGTKEPYLVGTRMGVRREYPHDLIGSMVDSTFHALTEDAHGTVRLRTMPNFTRKGKAVYTFDDYIDLKEADFTIDNSEMFNSILIKCGNKANRFKSTQIKEKILRGQHREAEVELPWADTKAKRMYAAKALFNQMAMRWRKMTIGVPAYLPLELLDVVLVRERISQVNWSMHVRGIKTIYTSQGLFQLLELADNTGFKVDKPPIPPPKPPSDLPEFSTDEASVTIEVWDFSREDGDRLNIYFNGDKIKSSVYIRKEPFELKLDLKMGINTIKFVGVSAGKLRTLSARFKVTGKSGNVIFAPGSLPDLEMPRENIVNDFGYYDPAKRPVRYWNINRSK